MEDPIHIYLLIGIAWAITQVRNDLTMLRSRKVDPSVKESKRVEAQKDFDKAFEALDRVVTFSPMLAAAAMTFILVFVFLFATIFWPWSVFKYVKART